MECTKGFEGHVTPEFDFNIVDLLKCHFRVYSFAVLSFRPDMVIIQAMVKPYPIPNADINGIINLDEVNVIITKTLIGDLPSSSKIGCINVVKGGPRTDDDSDDDGEVNTAYPKGKLEDPVEVSFDITRLHKDTKLETSVCIYLGVHVNEPYPHFLIKCRLRYSIQKDYVNRLLNSSEVKSTLVNNIKAFKGFGNVRIG